MTTDAATLEFEDIDDTLRIIRLSGRLDIQGVNAIDVKFASLTATAARRIVVDLSSLDFIASIGIRSLVSNAKAQQQRGGRLVLLVGENLPVSKVLHTLGIDTVIPMCSDADEARQAALA